jgi:hypothetical protein
MAGKIPLYLGRACLSLAPGTRLAHSENNVPNADCETTFSAIGIKYGEAISVIPNEEGRE